MSDLLCKICNKNRPQKYRKVCESCRSRMYKNKYPYKYYFNQHRSSAKKRLLDWDITLEEFIKLWDDSGKWELKLAGEPWEMDRIDVNIGYTYSNIQIVEKYLNVELFYSRDRWNIDFRWRKRWSERNGKPIEECPF